MWYAAVHWQGDKLYPYAQGAFPAYTQTLGDGVMHQLSQSTHYWWCWVAIGVCVAYILVLNVLIAVLLTVLPRKFLVVLVATFLIVAWALCVVRAIP